MGAPSRKAGDCTADARHATHAAHGQYLEEQRSLIRLRVKLLGHAVARPPDLHDLAHRGALVRRGLRRLVSCLARSTLGQVLLMPLALRQSSPGSRALPRHDRSYQLTCKPAKHAGTLCQVLVVAPT